MAVDLTIDGDGLAIVTINRPDARNALSPAVLNTTLERLTTARHSGATALVVRGAGKVFCAGGDLGYVSAALDSTPETLLGELADSLNELVLALREFPGRVIAAIDGVAAGAGVGLAFAADIRVCGRSALLVPAFLTAGTTPDGGTSYALARTYGPVAATSILARNHAIDTDEMTRMGLADWVVPDGAASQHAVSLASELPPISATALLETRRLLDRASGITLREQLTLERASLSRMWRTTDCLEGARAFLEKRVPQFGPAMPPTRLGK
ncbi:enoyl-CoA hydratase/isomerase family protein [Sciscionella marina]|uniref:enoyl-CoA hydratase/isomerase family protein n=1 Tax=Sciscionella marina TaxID=508770 RepID=UPI00037A6062|nr:enoyl-CoA hydratase-related protein [Sciscionella marina]